MNNLELAYLYHDLRDEMTPSVKRFIEKFQKEYSEEIERLNNIISNMEGELMTIYLDIMEYNEDYAKREIKKLKGVDKE